ncbi:DEAD/DEAH box helicase [Paenibacillus sp. IB182496]|uniref:DEAD/DEAH box helicase n=1 Tax=Paenibacillus sabuli TaxID=2772509 RepID=A0A927GSN3_9BACL|nr:DEAD/DEAH box helicase [Paenibacillus sabuli]MBD2846466.1 DEAD/DEAH box helicase [Paenibacillus sabuli]
MKEAEAAAAQRLEGGWLAGEGVWLHAPQWNGPIQRLKHVLFAWHSGSWYGAEVEEHAIGGQSGLLLTPLLAADYLADPASSLLLRAEWSPQLRQLCEAARLIREALVAGAFAPSMAGWSRRAGRWQLHLEDAAGARYRQWQAAAAESGLEPALAEQWLALAVEEALGRSLEGERAQRRVAALPAAGRGAQSYRDEEDWWVALGWKRDETPFRVMLQLLEPEEAQGWRLRVVLQDREAPDRLYALREAGGSWEAEEPLPKSWTRDVAARMAKEGRKWQQALASEPELLQDDGLPREQLEERQAWTFLERGSRLLLEAGCSILLPGWWEAARRRKLRLKAKVKSSVGSAEAPVFGLDAIIQFDWKLAIGDLDLSEAQFRDMVERDQRLARFGNEWVHLDPRDLERLREWMQRRRSGGELTLGEVMELHLRGAASQEEDLDPDAQQRIAAEVELNSHLRSWLDQLQSLNELPLVDAPQTLRGELRPYQLEGVSWLAFLRRFGLGGCLADDMGLGKTVQFTAYLLHVIGQRESEEPASPSLLICPTSVIGNWEKELQRFAPTLRVMVHYGPRRTRGEDFAEEARQADLVITSYALAPLDEEELGGMRWDALCLDEAQNIKNVYTKQSAAVRKLRARHRIALTGTPMENRLTELWSIHDFMNPGYLGSLPEFRREVVQPIERLRDDQTIARLRKWVEPFMLRRVKQDPAIRLSLPDKQEARVYVSLTAEQGSLYESTVAGLMEQLDTLSPLRRRGLILATLTRLKQLCDHPALMRKEPAGAASQWSEARSNKLSRLLEMVEEIAQRGERCLIFTQFVGMGRTLQRRLAEQLGIPVPYLHGGVPKADRDTMIEAFQDPDQPACAFVLSLKAGGTGLNLTAANHVFHYDRWWNPAVENQATDRAFRIGQTRDVQVHKFVTLGTLEEKIDEMIAGKQSLSEQVVGRSENWITELSRDELSELFTLRRSWADR